MCGINGVTVGTDEGARELAAVGAMNDALVHRGPDEGGRVVHGRCAIGMRRLSIVDVEHGQQPMYTPDGRYAIVYNGELYDYKRMLSDLDGRGVELRTRCDTEVILQSYATDGIACLDTFNGMFAFGVSDRSDGSLLLVRDQIGIKPLYYYHDPSGWLAFSSELGALLSHRDVPRRLDHDSLASLLVDRFVADPFTLLRGVKQLPPGHFLRWREGRVVVERYYELRAHPQPRREEDALEELRSRLDETVRSQLVADVPVAAFLSGGIDSSTVVAYASRHLGQELHTFSVGFDVADYDESAISRAVAARVGSVHHELRIENSAFDPELMDRVVRHVGQPLGDVSGVPTLLLSEYAAKHVKVVLSGDGGDEFFGGYRHMFWAARIARARARTPGAVRQVALALIRAASSVSSGSLAVKQRRWRKALELTFTDPADAMRRIMALWAPEELAALLTELAGPIRPSSWTAFVEPGGVEPEEFAMDYLAKTSLVGDYLRKTDRMSMAASLEVRVPLLDRRIFEFALGLPLDLKVRGATGKYLLREAGRPMLPDAVYTHPKRGFRPPMYQWFNDDFWALLEESCAPGTDLAHLFRRDALDGMVRDGRYAYSHQHRVSYDAAAARAWLVAQLGRWIAASGVSL